MNQTRSAVSIIFLIFLITPCFSQTNGVVSFTFTIDNSAPKFNYFSSNTTTITNIDQSVLLSAYWEDEYEGLKDYTLETNISGAFTNDSAASFDNGWSNATKTFTNASQEGGVVYYQFHASDVNNNWNSTGFNTLELVSEAPQYSLVGQNSSNPVAGDLVLITSYWTDNFNIYNITLQTNHSGSWVDNQSSIINSVSGWGNYTFNTTGYSGEVVYWRVLSFDNATLINFNTSQESYFTVG